MTSPEGKSGAEPGGRTTTGAAAGRVGFVGLGGMGGGLVKNMLLKGVEVAVFDLDPDRTALAAGRGAATAASAAELAGTCEILAFCIGTAEAVQALTLGPEVAWRACARARSCSTTPRPTPTTSRS